MPRKPAAPPSTDAQAEPRRSSRIKEQPKVEAAPKKTAKPRAKKVKPADEKEDEVEEELDEIVEPTKPKSTKGRKRTTTDKDAEEPAEPPVPQVEEAPPSKKVRLLPSCVGGVGAYPRSHDRPNLNQSLLLKPPLSLNPKLHPRNPHQRLQNPHHGRLQNRPRLSRSLHQERVQGNPFPR